jgi:hypothetical protein
LDLSTRPFKRFAIELLGMCDPRVKLSDNEGNDDHQGWRDFGANADSDDELFDLAQLAPQLETIFHLVEERECHGH